VKNWGKVKERGKVKNMEESRKNKIKNRDLTTFTYKPLIFNYVSHLNRGFLTTVK